MECVDEVKDPIDRCCESFLANPLDTLLNHTSDVAPVSLTGIFLRHLPYTLVAGEDSDGHNKPQKIMEILAAHACKTQILVKFVIFSSYVMNFIKIKLSICFTINKLNNTSDSLSKMAPNLNGFRGILVNNAINPIIS